MPEISENSHKISAAQLFCILLLMRVSSELATRVTPAALLHIPTRLSRSRRTAADVSVSPLSTLMRAALDWRRQMLRLSSSALR